MRLGVRVQLSLVLVGLMLLAFVPLFFAVAGLTRSTLQSTRDAAARSLGRAVAAHISEARKGRADKDLEPLLHAEIGSAGLTAIAVYDEDGKQLALAGNVSTVHALPPHVPIEIERTRTVQTHEGRALEVLVPGTHGPVVALLNTDDHAANAGPLLGLVALYVGIFALAFMVFAYIALTRMIVRPIDQLSSAARRVSAGAAALEGPSSGAREIADLTTSFAAMTRQLRSEEKALRTKIEELERTTEELQSAHRTLVRSERLASVGRLSAGFAHEIGNPIAAILSFQELMLTQDLTEEEQHDFLTRMKRETERIHDILRQLLDFARPGAATKEGAKPQPGSATDAIHDAIALVRPQRSFRDVEVMEEVDTGLPLVPLSRGQLNQVLV
ncbi:MAG: two-component sensor histidine kinase, partial [Sorangium cellulosum]